MAATEDYSRPTPPEFARRRLAHLHAFAQALAQDCDKTSWPVQRLRELQTERLRSLLRHAMNHSRWHADRLKHLDLDTVTARELESVQPMTKQDLIENWDGISCDSGLTLDRADKHLFRAAETGVPEYFRGADGQYLIFASGGSSGLRTVMAYDFDGWTAVHLATARVPLAGAIRDGVVDAPRHLRTVGMFSASAANVHGVAPHCFTPPEEGVYYFDPSTPLPELVAALNAIQPEAIHSFPSLMHVLAGEALTGRLTIRPYYFMVSGEPLMPESHAAADQAFHARVYNYWAATETGPLAVTDGQDDTTLSVPEDNVVVELVAATPSANASVLVTNLVSRVLPLIRFQLSDEVVPADEDEDRWPTGKKIARVLGRSDDSFHYHGGVLVHPSLFRAVMSTVGAVAEYQVRQTKTGADITVRAITDDFDTRWLENRLGEELHQAGLPQPEVRVARADALDRHHRSGKFKSFIPLP